METIRWQHFDIEPAAKLLKRGGVLAFPTDTVYGLGVCYDQEKALNALKQAKGRPDHKPIPVMIASLEQAEKIAYISEQARRIMETFMPGALSVVLRKKPDVPAYVTNGMDTIALRMPNDQAVLSLIEQCGCPLLVSSANRSGQETALNGETVLSQLDGAIDAIIMGKAQGTLASTIVDCTGDNLVVLREGPIQAQVLYQVWDGERTEKRTR